MTRTPSAATYDDDFFAWTQEQATALRALPASAIGMGVDIEHVAEEIEDLGKRDLREVMSFLKRFFEHLIKINSWPTSIDATHWQVEALHFLSSAAAAYSPSMRQLLDLDRTWRDGQKLAHRFLAGNEVDFEPTTSCPFTLDDLLSEDFDLDAALAIMAVAKAKA